MSTIICGFSGIGKTTAEQKHRQILDMESSGYSHIWENGIEKGRNPQFPRNYINKLEELIENDEAYYYLLSCHEDVRNELKARGLKYIIVLPYWECKNEYIKRWLKRGSPIEFIKSMNDRWEVMINSCVKDTAPKIYLNEHEYLSDILII